jgi:NAD(P)-dependent dehydrogenase (short-subunit alcohol dehydrogenase family)
MMAKAAGAAKGATRERADRGGRVALVTGGGSGIGLACAERLLELGWKVAIADIADAALEAARKRFKADRDVRVDRLDVTDEAAAEALVAEIEAGFGPIAGVLNSAGIAADLHVFDTPVDLFRKILDINVVGSFIVGRAAARRMAKRRQGAIVNVASIAGLRGSKGRSAYGASKGAVITMTQVMANDLARHGIRVNAIAPGPVETPLVAELHTAADRALYRNYIPMRRYAGPREMAHAVAFLLDPEQAGYITGEVLAIDGGFRGAGIILPD